MTTLLNDLRYAVRQLRKAPGFALTAVLTLALGIGISAAMFTVVDGVLLRPLPVPHPSQVVRLGEANASGQITSTSLPDLRDWREHAKSFQDIAWYTLKFFDLKNADGTTQFSVNEQTSSNFFSMLQAEPMMGRTFLPQAGSAGNQGTVVLSHFVWQNYFHADKNILGKQVQLGDDTYTVIGVMPQQFYIPINDEGRGRMDRIAAHRRHGATRRRILERHRASASWCLRCCRTDGTEWDSGQHRPTVS